MPRVPNYTDDAGVPLNTQLSTGSGFRLNDNTAAIGNEASKMRQRDLNAISALYNAVAIRTQALVNKTRVSNATAAAMNQLNELQTNLLNVKGENVLGTKGENAEEEVPTIFDQWRKGSGDILNKVRDSLQNDVQKSMFDETFNSKMPEMTNKIGIHQLEQTEVAAKQAQQAEANSWVSYATASAQMGDMNGAVTSIQMALKSADDMNKFDGMPDNARSMAAQDQAYKILDGLSDQVPEGRFGDLVKSAKELVRKDQYNQLMKKWETKHSDAEARKYAEDIFNKYRNPDGTVDIAAAHKEIEDQAMARGRRKSLESNLDLDREAMKTIESSGNYDTPPNSYGAAGAYQFTPDLWKETARELGLPEDTPMTAENQDRFFNYKFNKYKEELGSSAAAAVAWYAGYQNGKRYAQGLTTGIDGDGNEYSFDAQQNGGPSVNEYVRRFNTERAKNAPSLDDTEDIGFRDKAREQFDTLVKDNEIKQSQINQNLVDMAKQYALNNQNATLSDAQAFAVQLSPDDPKRQMAIVQTVMSTLGQYEGYNNFDESRQFQAAQDYLASHPNATEADIRMQYPGMRESHYAALSASMGKAAAEGSKWYNQTTAAALKSLRKQYDTEGKMDEFYVFNSMNMWAAEYYKQNGRSPSDVETEEELRQLFSHKAVQNYGWWGGTEKTEYPIAAVPPGYRVLSPTTVMDENGVIMTWDKKSGTFYINDSEESIAPGTVIR